MKLPRRALAFLLFASAALAATPDDAANWTRFMAWMKEQAAANAPAGWKEYGQKLVADGLTPDEARARVEALRKSASEHGDELGRYWYGRLFTDPNQKHFNMQPNAFLVSATKDLKPGKALDLAAGQGRNALFLAQTGWDVTAMDAVDTGLKVAAQNATKAGVRLSTVNSRFEDFDYGTEQWDLITFIYTDAPMNEPAYVKRVIAALKPGGYLLIERPHQSIDKPDPELGAVREQDRANALLKYWGDLRVMHYEDTIGISDWQQTSVPREKNPMRILRFLAKKQPAPLL